MTAPAVPGSGLATGADRTRVLVVGEALTDVIHSAGAARESPGGSPANVALGLGRLGVETSFLTALGRDAQGEAIGERLTEARVAILPESWSLPRTSSAVAMIGSDGSARYEFDISWTLPDRIDLPAVRHLHVGSISAFLGPGCHRVERLVETLHGEATVSFDPNIRADLVGDHAEALARFQRLAAMADIVKLSDEDAAFLHPELSPEDAARAIASDGALVAVTRGAAGSALTAGGTAVTIDPVPARVVDTVGAGDSYMSALLAWFLGSGGRPVRDRAHVDLAAAGRFAARAAAITVSRPGAEPPTAAELRPAAEATPPATTASRDPGRSGAE